MYSVGSAQLRYIDVELIGIPVKLVTITMNINIYTSHTFAFDKFYFSLHGTNQRHYMVKPVYSGHLGPNNAVLIMEVSLFLRFINAHLYCIGNGTTCPDL